MKNARIYQYGKKSTLCLISFERCFKDSAGMLRREPFSRVIQQQSFSRKWSFRRTIKNLFHHFKPKKLTKNQQTLTSFIYSFRQYYETLLRKVVNDLLTALTYHKAGVQKPWSMSAVKSIKTKTANYIVYKNAHQNSVSCPHFAFVTNKFEHPPGFALRKLLN